MTSRDAILAAAQRHLNTHPTASMADLATAAGVGRATLHRHFSTREALQHELGTRSMNRWEQRLRDVDADGAVASGDPARIDACLRDLLSQYLVDSDEFGFSLTDPYVNSAPEMVERLNRLGDREAELYAAAQAAGVLRADLPPLWMSHATYGLIVAARASVVAGSVARRDLDTFFITTFLDGMGAR